MAKTLSVYPGCGHRLTVAALAVLSLSVRAHAQPAANPHHDFFEANVRPILERNCLSCHGAAQLGGLRMDTPQAMMKGGKDGPVLAPGKPDESLLVRAVRYE